MGLAGAKPRVLLALILAARGCRALVVTRRGALVGGAAAAVCGGARRATAAVSNVDEDIRSLRRGLSELESLLSNWDAATLNCRYAEVSRELLGADSKRELLEAATSSALMSKDNKNVKTVCKRDPEVVRLALGLDTKINKKGGPPTMFVERGARAELRDTESTSALVDADRVIRRCMSAVEDDDTLDAYVEASEAWLEAIAALDSSSYGSRSADFGAIISTTSGATSDSTLLDGSKRAAICARDALRTIVRLLPDPSQRLAR